MPVSPVEWLSNTSMVQTEPMSPGSEVGFWQYGVSMALVIGLLLVLAFFLKRFAARKKVAEEPAAEEEQLLHYVQFNARQLLLISAKGKKIRCLIMRGRTVEASFDLPQLTLAVPLQHSENREGIHGKPTFFAIWSRLIRGGK